MSRRNIRKLGKPPKGYSYRSILKHSPGFQTTDQARAEDASRIRMLRRVLNQGKLSSDERQHASGLLARFERAASRKKTPHTLSASVSARKARKLAILWLKFLYDAELDAVGGQATFFTIFPPLTWKYPSEELMNADPKIMLKRFYQHLKGKDGLPEDGWLFAGLHAEFNPETECFDFHLHGMVAGGMIERLDSLRKSRTFGPGQTNSDKSLIQITREPLRDPVRTITYSCQTWWPMKTDSDPDAPEGRGKRKRIPEPHHTRMVLWLDRFELEDITLLARLEVRGGRLIRTGSFYSKQPPEPDEPKPDPCA